MTNKSFPFQISTLKLSSDGLLKIFKQFLYFKFQCIIAASSTFCDLNLENGFLQFYHAHKIVKVLISRFFTLNNGFKDTEGDTELSLLYPMPFTDWR
jgi:hypothetical protein